MANHKHLAELGKGVDSWNLWRQNNTDEMPDFKNADLRDLKLEGADLTGADLSRADLRWADLKRSQLTLANLMLANLSDAKLSGANFGGTILYRADLTRADLLGTDLSGADLSEAKLNSAKLSLANFSGAKLQAVALSGAIFDRTGLGNVDLSTAVGLDTAKHLGPSSIGVDTVYRSGGNIPDTFLRGAGIPDGFIAYVTSLVGRPIEFYSCFISYSTKDEEFAQRLHADLQVGGVRCWFAPYDMKGGKKLEEQIDQAIRISEKLLLIISTDSIKSTWVLREIAKALKHEVQDNRRMIFPIRLVDSETLKGWTCLDADTGKDLAKEIREYFIPDFSNWKDHDSYKHVFEKLLLDLRFEQSGELRGQ